MIFNFFVQIFIKISLIETLSCFVRECHYFY